MKKELRQWKKVYLDDLSYVAFEMKETVEKPALILLNGEMGAGKTTFVKQFLEDKKATSPTYSIVNETIDMVYADFYRLTDASEISALELSLYLEGKKFFLVEWGEKYLKSIARELPEDFNIYSLDILINETVSTVHTNEENPARNFFLSSLKLD
ncbi:MAG: tRNA (adenosine(37)-N6)-threonylcarbamoyltransferase complex ATPase subunit type 1 TsaE [Bacteriovoracaceae bacterium]